MRHDARGETLSLWLDDVRMPAGEMLREDLSVDVCVVGGGIAGLTTAYLLQKEGKSVCILEDFDLGSGQSGRTTAHFATALDDRYYLLERYHGRDGAKRAAESHRAAIERVATIVRDEDIDCDLEFLDGYLFAPNETEYRKIDREYDAVHRAGLTDVTHVDRVPLLALSEFPGLRFPYMMQLHPMKYMKALAERIQARGGQIYTRTHVIDVRGGKKAFVKTKDGNFVHADSIVVATNTPINDLFAIHTKQAPYRTYAVGLRIPAGSVPKGLYWDTLDPYHYVRVQSMPDEDILIVGGEDHKTGQENHPEHAFHRLEKWTRERFPMAEAIAYKWSGQVMEPVDGLAYLGHNPMDPDNVYVITGDSGNGMTHTTIGATIITDQIMGRENPWEKLYSPSRISLKSAGSYIKENANVAAQYTEWLSRQQVEDIESIAPGEGAVIRNGTQQTAVYKNEYGHLTLRSAKCPHLGCVVAWNTVEKSWDCPCHGSRFDCHGRVLEGPAVSDLGEAKQGAPDPGSPILVMV